MLFWQVASLAGCVRSFILVHLILRFLATSAQTTDGTRLNFQVHLILTSVDHTDTGHN